MNSRERIQAVLNGKPPDHTPLTTWCFGLKPEPGLTWEQKGRSIEYWYSLRMEHLHTLPQPWNLDDELRRVQAWQSLGVDDVIDVSIPWSMSSEVTYRDTTLNPGDNAGDTEYPVMLREYKTPAGALRHAVKKTGEEQGPGWVVQPDTVPLIEDFNIPRATMHAVSSTEDIAKIRYLYMQPGEQEKNWFEKRMEDIAIGNGGEVAVQAWSAFGMDAAVWFCGAEGAVFMAMDYPEQFGKLMDIIAGTDYARTGLACSSPEIDIVVQRGWYSSTDFWSPALFDRYVFPHLKECASLAHDHGKKYGYVMTTGVATLGDRLIDAGVDLLYFADPVQDGLPLKRAVELTKRGMTVVGGANAVSLASRNKKQIEREIERAVEILSPTNRFILHPVDAVFPDTPWESIEIMIDCWRRCW